MALKEINTSTERIINHGNGTVVPEIYRLCKIFTSKGIFLVGENKK